jgi:hypothetical protein
MCAPPGWIGGLIPWQVPLFRTATAYGVLRDFEAFQDGLEFSMETLLRGDDESYEGLPMTVQHRQGDHAFKLGVLFADGRTARSDDRLSVDEPDTLSTPRIHATSGGGRPRRGVWQYETRWWLWPLPSPGPLTWFVQWDEIGASETSFVVDASDVSSIAMKAEKVLDVE